MSEGISVIIPVYNSEKTLEKALNSVLSQTFPPLEVIVVNDGSQDRTLNILKAYCKTHQHIVVHNQLNSGPASARNNGVAKAQGKWIAFLDSDDYWYPFHLENLHSIIQQHPELRWASAAFDREVNNSIITERIRLPKGTNILESYLSSVKKGHSVHTNTVLIHRSTFLELEGFRNDWHVSEDSNLWYRFGIYHPRLGYSTIPSSCYCHTTGSISVTARKGNKVLKYQLRSLDTAIDYANKKDVLKREDVNIYLSNNLNNILKTKMSDSRQEMINILKTYRKKIPYFSFYWKTIAYFCLTFMPFESPSKIAQTLKKTICRKQ